MQPESWYLFGLTWSQIRSHGPAFVVTRVNENNLLIQPPMSPTTRSQLPQARPRSLAIVCNPLSGWVRPRWDGVRESLRGLAPAGFRDASAPEDLGEAALELTEEGVRVLCVVGGDGTVQAVLTALAREVPVDRWPILSVIPAGSTNMSAKDLGMRRSPRKHLERLEAWSRGAMDEHVVRRPVVSVTGSDGVHRCGMFFGAGAVPDGVAFLRERLYQRGIPESQTTALSVAYVLWRFARGGERARAMTPRIECRVDDRRVVGEATATCLITTLDRLILGMRPHWGTEGAPLRFTLSERYTPRAWLNLPRLATGRPGRHLTPENGYHSHNADQVTLRFDGAYVIDGELYRADSTSGDVEISAITGVEWLVS